MDLWSWGLTSITMQSTSAEYYLANSSISLKLETSYLSKSEWEHGPDTLVPTHS